MIGTDPLARFNGVSQVVADSLRFKRKLAIGEDAYTSLRLGKVAARIWDVGGVAATGAGMAASSTVASTFFASSGWLASLGLGAAAVTPIGWVVGAAVLTGGAYYGVTRAIGGYAESRVEVIPKFINSPIDQLGAALLDMMGALGMKVAMMDGVVAPAERTAMVDYFVDEWGFDRAYATCALEVIEAGSARTSLKDMAAGVAAFVHANPDCNAAAFRAQLLDMLREVAQADGVLDEREEMAIAAIDTAFANAGGIAASASSTLGAVTGAVGGAVSSAAEAVSGAVNGVVSGGAATIASQTAKRAADIALESGKQAASKAARLAALLPSAFPKRR